MVKSRPALARRFKPRVAASPSSPQYLLHNLWVEGLAEATPVRVEAVAYQMRRQRAADLQNWWEAVGKEGRSAYRQLAAAAGWVTEQTLLAEQSRLFPLLDQGLAALCYHGLAAADLADRRYRLAGLLFRDWFRQHEGSEQ